MTFIEDVWRCMHREEIMIEPKRDAAKILVKSIKQLRDRVVDAQETEIVNHFTNDELYRAQLHLEHAMAVILGENRRRWKAK